MTASAAPAPVAAAPRRLKNYALGRRIGAGGMATVFAAHRLEPSGARALVAVKVMSAAFLGDAALERMFVREAEIATRLQHPNVVRTYEVGDADGDVFLAMEVIHGAPLSRLWKDAGAPLPVGLAARITSDVARGLHAAHELRGDRGELLGVVHQDVTPQNVMVGYDGVTRLLDFGVARLISVDGSRTERVRGKPAYLAPEQVRLERLDRRADVFALGILLCELVTGARLFPLAPRYDRPGEIPELEALASRMPAPLARVVSRALRFAPEERYESAEAMRVALHAACAEVGATLASDFEVGRWASQTTPAPWSLADLERELLAAESYAVDHAQVADLPTMAGSHSRRRRPRAWVLVPAFALAASAVAWSAVHLARRPSGGADGARPGAGIPSIPTGAGAHESACATSAECVQRHDGRPFVCRARDRACISLASDDCTILSEPGDVGNDATIWFGAMLSTTGPHARQSDVNAAELARRDFASISHGLPPAHSGGPPRPLGLVVCDDHTSPTRAARHLVDDVGVPAVIGFASSQEAIDLSTSTFLPNHVLAIPALNVSALITSIPHPPGEPRLVWRTNVSVTRSAAPISRIVSDLLEPRLRASAVVPAGRPMKVALVRSSSATQLSLVDELVSVLRFNGKSIAENAGDFRQVVFDDPAGAGAKPDFDAVVREVAAFAPHVLVYTEGVVLEHVVAALEERWPARLAYRPRYVADGIQGDRLYEIIGTSAERRRRFFLNDLPASTNANVKFAMRYNELFSPKVTPGTAPGVVYDAFYVLAYATYAAGDPVPTGPGLARAMSRLVPPGVPIDVGPTKIFEAFNALRDGKAIDLDGAATRLDFDLSNGEPSSDFAVYCVAVDAAGRAVDSVESGVVYDARTGHLRGKLRCD